MLSEPLQWWLSGYIDAKDIGNIDDILIRVRQDELPTLIRIQRMTGLGMINPHIPTKGNPAATWTAPREDVLDLIEGHYVSNGFWDWLGGYIDGKGGFSIRNRGHYYVCVFQLNFGFFDDRLMALIRKNLGVGYTSNWQHYEIYKKDQVIAFRDSLEEHEVRLLSKRGYEYEVWSDAVDYWATCPGRRTKKDFNWKPLEIYRQRLETLRVFREL